MAKMTDTLVIKVVNNAVSERCQSIMQPHDFDYCRQGTEGFLLFWCRNCGMMLDVRLEDASRS